MEAKTLRYHLIKNILTLLNEKFTLHGVRVAYISLKMCQYENRTVDKKLRNFIEAALLHDIGAYSTEEVKDMLRFETTTTLNHSYYGYLFLKYLSEYKDYAETIKYHHTKYIDRHAIKSIFLPDAFRIHLADRVDISFLNNDTEKELIQKIKKMSGVWFNPSDVDLFIKANEKYHIVTHLENNDFEQDLIDFYSNFDYDFQEILSILRMLTYSIDFRSEQTVIHTISSAITAKELGKYFNLSDDMQEDLYIGALLHDIGKIDVPLEILESTERLSEEEMVIMRGHVDKTEKIIKGYVSDQVVKIASRHHERLDGSGYPNHLTAKDLSLSERIVAVSDVFCALVEKRTYKNSYHKEEVLGLLHQMANDNLFDKHVIDALTENYDNILKSIKKSSFSIRSKYTNLKTEYLNFIKESEKNNITFASGGELFPAFTSN